MTDSLALRHDVALLDLDGVVYIGDDAVDGAVEGLAAARATGMGLAFVTNNAGRPPEDVAEHLGRLGIPATVDEVVTSAQAGARVLADRLPAGAPVLAVGGTGVALAIERAGLSPVAPGEVGGKAAVAVLQGFGRDLGWRDLAAAATAVQQGALWVLTNPDLTLPTPDGPAPGNGSLARAVEAAAGRPPDVIAGKPHPALMAASIERTGASAPLVVGDRLDTDIAGAATLGIASLLVLTGICDIAGLLSALPGERPDYVGSDLGALTAKPAPTRGADGPRPHDGRWMLAGASAWTDGGEVRVEGADDVLAAVQCACAAAWSAADRGESTGVSGAAAMLETARRTVVP